MISSKMAASNAVYELQKKKMDAYRQTNRGDHVGSRTGLCYYIRYALASDNSMVQNLEVSLLCKTTI